MVSITNSSRVYRPHPMDLTSQRRFSTSVRPVSIMRDLKQICMVLLIGLFAILSTNYYMNSQLFEKKEKVQELHTTRRQLANENMQLLATRARLMSEGHIKTLAAENYKLTSPDESRIHRM